MSATLFLMMLLAGTPDPTTVRDLQLPDVATRPGGEVDLRDRPGTWEPARWINPPSPEAASELIPYFANGIGVGARVGLSCWAREQGIPQDCEVTNSPPEGLGFEAAAIEVARTGVIRLARLDGQPVPGQIAFNVVFQPEPVETLVEPTPYEGPEPTPTAISLARRIVLATLEESVRLDEEEMLAGLAADRREIVRGWIHELMPLGDEIYVANQTLMIARLSQESEMEAWLADGTPPASPPPTIEDMARASSDMHRPEDAAQWKALRDRYCARWSCTSSDPTN